MFNSKSISSEMEVKKREATQAVIFDMDGIIIDSEPFWKEADIKAYGRVGIQLTAEQCAITTGLGMREAVQYWYNRHPWTGRTLEQVAEDIENTVIDLVQEHGKPMKGLDYILDFLEKKHISLALASSSNMRVIETVLDKLNIKHRFKVYHSAQFEKAGKPAPDVFLTAANKLGVKPENCLVFEDSANGMLAAKAAGMKLVGIPDAHFINDPRIKVADYLISSFYEVTDELWKKVNGG